MVTQRGVRRRRIKLFGRSVLLDAVTIREAAAAAKGGDAALGGDASAGEDEDAIFGG